MCMRVSAGISGQCMVSKRYNAFVHSDHIWYTEAKKVARPQHCKRKSHPARTSSKVSHRDAFSVRVGSCCPRLSFMYCKMMLMPQANRLSSPWCMVRYVCGRIDELERSWWFRMCSQHWNKRVGNQRLGGTKPTWNQTLLDDMRMSDTIDINTG